MEAIAALTVLALVLAVGATACARHQNSAGGPPRTAPLTTPVSTHQTTPTTAPHTTDPPPTTTAPPPPPPPWRPRPVFDGRLLVAYYGTYGTGSLGILGSAPIDTITRQLRAVAATWEKASARPVQIVYELIATVADGFPGPDDNYSHDIPRAEVETYMAAARRNHALLVLDLQPGRSDFLTIAKRYAWALAKPYVGIALDPEWRMDQYEIPGQVFGSVSAAEVNATARYVAGITRKDRLPQKLFLIHQFVPSMVTDIAAIHHYKGLAMVQHVDGFGAQQDKLATYHNVARPHQFIMGMKLFYKQDIDMFTPKELLTKLPAVRYISYQ